MVFFLRASFSFLVWLLLLLLFKCQSKLHFTIDEGKHGNNNSNQKPRRVVVLVKPMNKTERKNVIAELLFFHRLSSFHTTNCISYAKRLTTSENKMNWIELNSLNEFICPFSLFFALVLLTPIEERATETKTKHGIEVIHIYGLERHRLSTWHIAWHGMEWLWATI